MAAVNEFADAEDVIASHLDSIDEVTVPVVTQIPNPRPPAFVRVIRTGGPARDVVHDRPIFTIESWDAIASAAAARAQLVRRLLNAAVGAVVDGVTVGRWNEISGPQNLPDPTSGQHRYTFAGELPLRGLPPTGS